MKQSIWTKYHFLHVCFSRRKHEKKFFDISLGNNFRYDTNAQGTKEKVTSETTSH